ncbi:hypothetical protein D3Y59_16790 [Hymenobacter oligotrophus]|uniref:Uncharacterized protein n=1 Tax=Hymenobacter oligotrophus TaxID=2319843 RepID=A0A3B7RVW5_9BACT|nr:hypothetical protein [Hymenobacter oligotrophus]AYA38557.1 hypothetical protein D3Y59_16790 [Hymenobacter oligotrophus]
MSQNADERRQERREEDKGNYRNAPESRYQPDRNNPPRHHDRNPNDDGDATQDFNTIADDGTSDGIAKTAAGSGANNLGSGGLVQDTNTRSRDADQGGTQGGGRKSDDQSHLRTPSAQSSHRSQGNSHDGGQSAQKGSRSGEQV